MQTKIFVGRETELEQFHQALGKRGLLRQLLHLPGRDVHSRVFLPHGIGGIGKTWLSQRCLGEADKEGWATIKVDWDRADYRPSEPDQLMDIVAERIRSRLGEKAIKPYWKTRTQARQVRDRVTRYRQENQEKWQNIVNSISGMTEAAAGLARGKKVGAAAGGAMEKAGSFVGEGAALLAQAEDAFIDWLIEREKLNPEDKSLYRNPETELADRLVDAFVTAARRRPLVVLFDTCEELSLRLEEWLRDAIVCPTVQRDVALMFIVVGRFNQYVGREVEYADGNRRYIKGYADRLSDPPPIAWDLSRFADPEIIEYLKARDLEPTEELVELVQELARGVPFAVQLVTDALCDLGVERVREDFVSEDVDLLSPQQMVTRVVRRFLSYCVDAQDRNRVRALAVLRRTDPEALRRIWKLEESTSPQSVLADLEARYSFVQTGGQLHDVVRDFLQDDLRGTDRERAHRLGRLAADYYRPLWEQTTADIERLDEQVADPRWRKQTLDLLNALCWGSEDRVIYFAAARIIETMQFDLGFSRVLLKLTREFREPVDWWSGRHHRVLNLLTRIVEGGPKEEWAGLEGFMGQVEELDLDDAHQCILHLWQGRNLSRRNKHNEALAALKQARRYLPEEGPALKRQLGEAFKSIGERLAWRRRRGEVVDSLPSEKAAFAFAQAIDLGIENASVYHALGAVQIRLEQPEASLENRKRAVEVDPEYASAWNGLGIVYRAQGRYEEAIAAYQRAIDLDPEDAAFQASFAAVCRELGREKDYEQHIRRARELMANESDYNKACIESIAGNIDAALDHLAKALERAPGLRDWARRDPDLAFIRDDPRFQALVEKTTSDERNTRW
jgi:tetratricopeptide (TPR) repeat protein